MKIPAVLDEIVRRAEKRQPQEAGRTDLIGNAGAGSFKNILETQLAASGEKVSGVGPAGVGDEKKIAQIIEIIRLRMMLDEHLLESMRDKGDDQSLYQRFSRWQLGGLNAVSPPAGQAKARTCRSSPCGCRRGAFRCEGAQCIGQGTALRAHHPSGIGDLWCRCGAYPCRHPRRKQFPQ